jgi:hypothetical protein
VGAVDPAAQKVPCAQVLTVAEPELGQKLPAGHTLHAESATELQFALVTWPEPHEVQVLGGCPAPRQNDWGGHCW